MTRYHQVLGGQLDVMTVADMPEERGAAPGPPNHDLVIHAALALGAGDLLGDQPPCHRACADAVAHEGGVRVLVAVPGYSVALHYSLGGERGWQRQRAGLATFGVGAFHSALPRSPTASTADSPWSRTPPSP